MTNLLAGDDFAYSTKTMLEDALLQVYGRNVTVTGYETYVENSECCYKVQVSNPCENEYLTLTSIQLITAAYSSRKDATEDDNE